MAHPCPYNKDINQRETPMLQVQAFQADRCFRYEMDAEELAEWLQWEGCFFDRVLVDGKEA